MSLILSTTTIIIISASIGGTFLLAALIGVPIFITRRAHKRQKYSGSKTQPGTTDDGWDMSNAPYRQTIPRPLSSGLLYRKPSQAASQYPRQSWMLQGLLPSRQNSVIPSEWAVRNGSHVPRPHRLKKSKSTIRPESYLLGVIIGEDARQVMSRENIHKITRNNASGLTHTVPRWKAQISTPAGKSHVMSMAVTPEQSPQYDLHNKRVDSLVGDGVFATLRRSLIFSNKSRSPSKSPIKKKKVTSFPGTVSTSKEKARRSMSVPFVPTSEPPSSAIPPLPNHAHIPFLIKSLKSRNTNNSPSKDSFVSRTTIGSSIFEGLSPSLRKDLEEMSANLKRPTSRWALRRRSSAPNLPTKSFPWSEYVPAQLPERNYSGASSQLLPSPAKTIIRKQKNRVKKAGISKSGISRPRLTIPAEFKQPRRSLEGSKVRARDTPISLSGLSADWNVFGYGDQVHQLGLTAGIQESNFSITPLSNEGQATDRSTTQENALAQAQNPKLLQKKWTRSEDYPPLSFATIAYSSTTSLDPPLIMPLVETHRSSMLLTQMQRDDPGIRSVTSLYSTVQRPISTSTIALDAAIKEQIPTPYPGRGLFGPRRMPSITSRMSISLPVLPNGHDIQRPQSRIGRYNTSSSMPQANSFNACKSTSGKKRYQFEEVSSDEEDEPTSLYFSKARSHGQVCVEPSCVVPPPVRLDPTPLRQSFYGYEAASSSIPYSTNPVLPNRQTTGEFSETCLTLPARASSAGSFAAPRPLSNLSNSSRLSASFPAGSVRNSFNANRLSYRASMLLSSSPPPHTAPDSSRPPSVVSTNMQSDNDSSMSATPLKNYSHFCDMFPHPLSMSSDFSSLKWPASQEMKMTSNPLPPIPAQSTEQRCPSSPRPAARGLPSGPRYNVEQRLSGTRGIHLPQDRSGVQMTRSIRSTTGKHSPLRRSLARVSMTAKANTQDTSSFPKKLRLTNSSVGEHTQPNQLPIVQTGTPLTLQIVNSLREENSAYKEAYEKGLLREKVLGPISVNIGSQIPFKGNKSEPRKVSQRYREMSPSPSPRGSTHPSCEVNHTQNSLPKSPTGMKSPYGAIGEERTRQSPISNRAIPFQIHQPPNGTLKRRFEEAKLRKSQASQAENNTAQVTSKSKSVETTTATTIHFTGLGISIPSAKPSSAEITQAPANPIISTMKRKADSTTEPDALNCRTHTAGKRLRSSALHIPHPVVTVAEQSNIQYPRSYYAGTSVAQGGNSNNSHRQNGARLSPLRKVRFSEDGERSGIGGDGGGGGSGGTEREGEREGKGFTYRVSFRDGRRFAAGDDHDGGYKVDGGSGRTSSSPGRIWREEVF